MGHASAVSDATEKWWIIDRRTARTTDVLIRSSQREPEQVALAVERQAAVRRRLSRRTAAVVLQPTRTGVCEERSFAIYPCMQPLSPHRVVRRCQRWRLAGPVLTWLNQAVAETAQDAHDRIRRDGFEKPLETLITDHALDHRLRSAAEQARQQIDDGTWQPRSAVAHNDFWLQNLLLAPRHHSGGYGFVVIDWGLANAHGQPFYDLMQIAQSLPVRGPRLSRAVHAHCAAVGCAPRQAIGHLLAGLGWLRQNLNHFPHERFIEAAHGSVLTLAGALAEGDPAKKWKLLTSLGQSEPPRAQPLPTAQPRAS